MLENCISLQERWGGVSKIIDAWLQERKHLLVCYSKICAFGEFENDNLIQGQAVREFCEIMVDYISAGHFEVYRELLAEADAFNDFEAENDGHLLLKVIQASTEICLDFNDKYTETDDLESLGDDVSRVGMALSDRFEVEDEMIERLHNSHLQDLLLA